MSKDIGEPIVVINPNNEQYTGKASAASKTRAGGETIGHSGTQSQNPIAKGTTSPSPDLAASQNRDRPKGSEAKQRSRSGGQKHKKPTSRRSSSASRGTGSHYR